MASYTQAGQTRKRIGPEYVEESMSKLIAGLKKWETRVSEARCPRCGKRVGRVVNDVVHRDHLHCGPCRDRWLARER